MEWSVSYGKEALKKEDKQHANVYIKAKGRKEEHNQQIGLA